MIHAFRNDNHLTRADAHLPVPELDGQFSLDDEEQFIFPFVMVPIEFAFQFGQFDIRVVQLADDLGTPEFMEQAVLLLQIDFLHTCHRLLLLWDALFSPGCFSQQ